MGDDKNGLVFYQTGQGGLDQGFVFHVERGSGLIQQNNWSIFEKCPCNGNTLPLTAGKFTAVFPNSAVPLVRQLFGKLVAVGEPRSRQYFFVRGIFIADTYIL